MKEVHKDKGAEVFAGWMQAIVKSSATESNAFSVFMHNETNRVLRDTHHMVLAVPGVNS